MKSLFQDQVKVKRQKITKLWFELTCKWIAGNHWYKIYEAFNVTASLEPIFSSFVA